MPWICLYRYESSPFRGIESCPIGGNVCRLQESRVLCRYQQAPAWSGVILSLCSMWMADVARKVCTRGRLAKRTASHAVSRSL